MKKSIIIMIIVFYASGSKIAAQTTIGSDLEPVEGAILQLKENDNLGANSIRGLRLPIVRLKKLTQLFPMFDTTPLDQGSVPNEDYNTSEKKAEQNKVHIGLIVYSNDGLCPIFEPGVYTWNGQLWASTKVVLGTVVGRSGTVYPTRVFGQAGEWMIENLRETQYDTQETQNLIEENKNKDSSRTTRRYYYGSNGSYTDAAPPAVADRAFFDKNPEIGLLYTPLAATNGKYNTPVDEDGAAIFEKSTVQGICPNGWVLPSDYEWSLLEREISLNAPKYSRQAAPGKWIDRPAANNYFDVVDRRPASGSTDTYDRAMKTCKTYTGAYRPDGLSDVHGFNVLFPGMILAYSKGSLSQVDNQVRIWTSTKNIYGRMFYRDFYSGNVGVARSLDPFDAMYAVRCKKRD